MLLRRLNVRCDQCDAREQFEYCNIAVLFSSMATQNTVVLVISVQFTFKVLFCNAKIVTDFRGYSVAE